MDEVFARIRDCTCPGTPHDEGDGVYLRPTVSLSGGLALERDYQAAVAAILPKAGSLSEAALNAALEQELIDRWFPTCIRVGATGWNVLDENGPVPFDPELLIADYNLGRNVADTAADLYGGSVLVPLATRLSETLLTGLTDVSTSPTPPSNRQSRRSSSRATSAASGKSAA